MIIPKFYEVLFGIYIYILEFKNGKFYVGISRDPEYRFRRHREGKTSKFVKENLPIKYTYIKLLDSTDWSTALIEETRQTAELIKKHGIENVCGGAIKGDLKMRITVYNNYLKKQYNDY
jgi:predicted GIY-YIG superfamily endonuclease